MTMLTGTEILKEVRNRRIEVEPFEEDNIQPASLDLRLGNEVKVYSTCVFPAALSPTSESSRYISNRLVPMSPKLGHYDDSNCLSLAGESTTEEFTIDGTGWVLKPGILYLMHTHERLHTEHYATDIMGKSSTARIGVQVHLTAGFGDPGFDGQYTLEVSVVHPVILYAGELICQARFWELTGHVTNYQERGSYVGDRAMGPHAAAQKGPRA